MLFRSYCKCWLWQGDGGVGNIGNMALGEDTDWFTVEGTGGKDDATSAGGGEFYTYLTWGCSSTVWEFRWRVTHANGSVSHVGITAGEGQGTATIPPCERWDLQARFLGWDGEEGFMGLESYPVASQEPCPFAEGEELEGTQTLYSPVNHLGIPSNSDELADFLAWENGAKAACAAAGGTWNEETLSCDMPE